MTEEVEKGTLTKVEKLLVLGLVRQGLTQNQLAASLGMHRTTLSRQFPKGLLAEVAKGEGGAANG